MLDRDAEEKLYFDLYMTFNDNNYTNAEASFVLNGYINLSARGLFKVNQEFIKEIMERKCTVEDIISRVPEAVGHFPKN